eukprot:6204798-Pleurochrysis_carterae.AAC.1
MAPTTIATFSTSDATGQPDARALVDGEAYESVERASPTSAVLRALKVRVGCVSGVFSAVSHLLADCRGGVTRPLQ